ncbi:RHS repeat domain-containing protein [Chryseobacterium gallinarum]|uniref:RHS repeat protein n=1 Tax=Chryseobacterium gallinarum TaxID=1324352 RepID=A0ABX6KPE4_CHRGL|nr:RHS repeat domain-containing protein [Chryseobacterium gallinarum]QIY90496.1 RHS repeat protein [Chryseobacterium gallinarum]
MRKYLIFLLLTLYTCLKAQNNPTEFSKPIPTLSYLSTYVDTPVDLSTGIPKIDLPVFDLPTRNKNVSINLGMSYHVRNAARFQKSSDVGLGWSLMNINNAISKVTIGAMDEKAANNPQMNMDLFQFDDVFFFNAFGMSGKFVFRKSGNIINVQNLGTSKEKIEFTNSPNKFYDILDFKITDEYGNQYFFNKSVKVLDNYYNETYTGAYYLTKVLDVDNQEIVKIEYAEYPYSEYQLSMVDYKPKKIISKDYGVINLEYDYFPENRYKSNTTNMSDCYRVKKVELKDTENKLIQEVNLEYGGFFYYKYEYGNTVTYATTTLDKIIKRNSQGNEIETRSFVYNTTGTDRYYGPSPNFGFDVCPTDPEPIREWIDNPKYSVIGTLSKMILPTKGYVKFNFESNQFDPPAWMAGMGYISGKETYYFKPITSFDFDTKINSTFTFNVTSTGKPQDDFRELVFCFQVIGYDPNPLLDPEAIPNITFFVDGQPLIQTADGYGRIYMPVCWAGPHTITIGGNTTGVGYLSVSERTEAEHPQSYVSKYGVRIRSIETFNSESSVKASNSKTYYYEKFMDPNGSSGVPSLFTGFKKSSDFITMYGGYELNRNIIYKNVKEVDRDGGYTKYTFIGMDDINPAITSTELDYLEDLNNRGLLKKKEMFDSANQMIASESHEYTTQTLSATPIMVEQPSGYLKLNPIYIKKHNITNTFYYPQNRFITSSKETQVNKFDFNVDYTKETTEKGVYETYYFYPQAKLLNKLLDKNIYKYLLEKKEIFNGKTIFHIETKYDDPSNLFPSSGLSYDLQNNPSTDITYNQYDSKGNLLQYTTKDGISTVIIWGYNQTQPIAKIEGAKLSDIQQSLIDSIVNASNTDAAAGANNDEANVLDAFNTFRNSLLGYQVTTYTYDPLVGVRSITPPSGIRESYMYDAAGRLEKVIDANGKVLKEMKYNYKN